MFNSKWTHNKIILLLQYSYIERLRRNLKGWTQNKPTIKVGHIQG